VIAGSDINQAYVYTASYKSDGSAVLWSHVDTASGYDYAVGLNASGQVIVAGADSSGVSNAYVAAYSSDGQTKQWSHLDSTGGANGTLFTCLTLDGAGNILVGGGYNTASSSVMHTVKYAPDGSSVLWHMDDSSNALGVYGYGIAVDHAGNAVVIGDSTTDQNHGYANMHLVTYRSSDGAVLWTKDNNSGGNSGYGGSAVAVQPGSGDVVGTGSMLVGGVTNMECQTVSYGCPY